MTVLLFIVPAVVSALLAFALTPVARRLALRVGAVDQPGPRKIHSAPIPRLGGLAVVVAVAAVLSAIAIIGPARTHMVPSDLLGAIAIGVVPILIVSLIDDVRPLRAVPKFIVHLAGASATVALGVRLGEHVHLFGQQVHIGWLAIPISIVWLAGTTNAFNIVDGLDGLSAGLALISAISLAAVSLVAARYDMAAAAAVLAGALAGFLPYNTFPAKVYLGDTGATAIGFFLGALTLRGGSTATAGLAVVLPLLVVGVPVAETLLSMIRRTVRRMQGGVNSILDADRDHIHHRLLALGYTQQRAVMLLYTIGVVVAVCGFASVFLDQQKAAVLLATLFLAALVGIARLGYDEFAIIKSGAVLKVYDKPVLKKGFFAVFVDLALVVTALYAAIVLKYDDWGLREHRALAISLLALAPAAIVATFSAMGIYRRAWGFASVDDLARLSASVLIAVIATMVIARLSGSRAPITFFAMYGIIVLGLINGSRASHRVLYHWNRRSNQEGQPVIIYGAGKGGILALREMLTNDDVLMKPIGFIDDDPTMRGRFVNGYPVFGDIDALEDVVVSSRVDGVVIASEKIPVQKIGSAKRICERNGAWVTYFEVTFRRPPEPEFRRRHG